MNQTYTAAERIHVQRVKALPCSVCDAPPPSQAHHVKQSDTWTMIALCGPCHGGPGNPHGWHGDRQRWKLRKLFEETDALNVTLRRLFNP